VCQHAGIQGALIERDFATARTAVTMSGSTTPPGRPYTPAGAGLGSDAGQSHGIQGQFSGGQEGIATQRNRRRSGMRRLALKTEACAVRRRRCLTLLRLIFPGTPGWGLFNVQFQVGLGMRD